MGIKSCLYSYSKKLVIQIDMCKGHCLCWVRQPPAHTDKVTTYTVILTSIFSMHTVSSQLFIWKLPTYTCLVEITGCVCAGMCVLYCGWKLENNFKNTLTSSYDQMYGLPNANTSKMRRSDYILLMEYTFVELLYSVWVNFTLSMITKQLCV